MSQTPPPASPPPPPEGGQPPVKPAAEQIKAPAIALLVTGIIGIVFGALSLLANAFNLGAGALQDGEGRAGMMFEGASGMAAAIAAILFGIFVIYGASQMQKLRNYGLAMGTSIVAMVPCISPCCLLGLPFGIWALIVLNKPEVKAAFEG